VPSLVRLREHQRARIVDWQQGVPGQLAEEEKSWPPQRQRIPMFVRLI
jgi:hypothetical protein